MTRISGESWFTRKSVIRIGWLKILVKLRIARLRAYPHFARITLSPVKTIYLRPVNHESILLEYTIIHDIKIIMVS